MPTKRGFVYAMAAALWLQVVVAGAQAVQNFGGTIEIAREATETDKPEARRRPRVSDDATLLKEHGIEPTRQSLEKFLDELVPDKERIALTRELIKDLGDPQFDVRNQAMNQLLRTGGLSEDVLREALEGDDPERAYRVRQILDAMDSSTIVRLRLAAFRRISELKPAGLTSQVIAAFPYLNDEDVRSAAAQAIVDIAEESDVKTLKVSFESTDYRLKIASLQSLLDLAPDEAFPLLKKTATAEDEETRLQAARLYAQRQRSECLDILLRLLDAENATVRGNAHVWLRRITKQNIGFAAWGNKAERRMATDQWSRWVADHRDGLLIEFHPTAPKLGRILAGMYGGGKVVEYDMYGKQLWEAPLANAFCCQGLPNGHRLVGQYSLGRVTEFDAQGNIFKEFVDLPSAITSVQRLETGNTLIAAGRSGDTILELNPAGKRVWQLTMEGTPIHASMLETGRLLVSLNTAKQVCEIDRDGDIKWKIDVVHKPYSAVRLPNGNTLVSFAKEGVIAEFDSKGKRLRFHDTGEKTYHAELLDNGNLIYADVTGIEIMDQEYREILRIESTNRYTYVNHY